MPSGGWASSIRPQKEKWTIIERNPQKCFILFIHIRGNSIMPLWNLSIAITHSLKIFFFFKLFFPFVSRGNGNNSIFQRFQMTIIRFDNSLPVEPTPNKSCCNWQISIVNTHGCHKDEIGLKFPIENSLKAQKKGMEKSWGKKYYKYGNDARNL